MEYIETLGMLLGRNPEAHGRSTAKGSMRAPSCASQREEPVQTWERELERALIFAFDPANATPAARSQIDRERERERDTHKDYRYRYVHIHVYSYIF